MVEISSLPILKVNTSTSERWKDHQRARRAQEKSGKLRAIKMGLKLRHEKMASCLPF